MKALLWKEWRENYRWALLAALVLGACEIMVLRKPSPSHFGSDGIGLSRGNFLSLTLYGSALAGVALGACQMLPELRRDRWATLRHRPLPVGRLFLGKVVAGGTLYLFAVGAPLLVSLWLVATPGHFATPFVAASVEPAIVDSIGGFGFYLAAMLAALEAGSILRRALPVLAAMFITDFAVEANLFPSALAAQSSAVVALLAAGWGAVHARERWSARPWLGRVGSLVVAVLGFSGIGHLVVLMSSVAGSTGPSKYETFEFLQDGRVIRSGSANGISTFAVDLDGGTISETQLRELQLQGGIVRMGYVSSTVGETRGWRRPVLKPSYRQSPGYVQEIGSYSDPREETWYFLEGDGRFVSMGLLGKREEATFGPEGFAGPGVRKPGFVDGETPRLENLDPMLVWQATGVKLIDLPRRKVIPLPIPEGERISGAAPFAISRGNSQRLYIGVALSDRLALYETSGKPLVELPYQRDVSRWGMLEVGAARNLDRYFILYSPSGWIAPRERQAMPSYLEIEDAHGNLISTRELPALPVTTLPPSWSDWTAGQLRAPVSWAAEKWWPASQSRASYGWVRMGGNYFGSIQTKPIPSRVPLLLAALLAPGIVVFARRARLPAKECGGWALLVLFTGWVGFAVYWCCGERPKTKTCASCGQPRRLDLETCELCGAAWERRPADGSEILEPALTGGLV